MYTDTAFFGFARAGKINDLDYPLVLNSEDLDQISYAVDGYRILSKHVDMSAIVPSEEHPLSQEIIELDDIIIMRNAASLLMRTKKFVSELISLHEKNRFRKLIYLPGVADPYLLPVLVYLGGNIFDDLVVRKNSLSNHRYGTLGYSMAKDTRELENLSFLNQIAGELKRSIENRTLRELVEKYRISGKAVEILRILDRDYMPQQKIVYPRFTSYIRANDISSLSRPDLTTYREKIASEYTKPHGKEVLLLLPCSARKPYSWSKSHQRIIEALSGLRSRVHEVIVTSPVGLVPRDLEGIYPAAFYDIPVIGQWFDEEKSMILDMLRMYLSRNSYGKVIAFIPEDLEFIVSALPSDSILIRGKAKDPEDLKLLRKEVSEAVRGMEGEKPRNEKLHDLLSMSSFQFGDWILEELAGARAIRSYNQDMLSLSGKVILVFNRNAGKMTITKSIATAFLANQKYTVQIDDFKPTANIYAVGVDSCTPDIRIEDEVVVVHGDEIRGVGTARMPFIAMKELKKGIAVKMRN